MNIPAAAINISSVVINTMATFNLELGCPSHDPRVGGNREDPDEQEGGEETIDDRGDIECAQDAEVGKIHRYGAAHGESKHAVEARCPREPLVHSLLPT